MAIALATLELGEGARITPQSYRDARQGNRIYSCLSNPAPASLCRGSPQTSDKERNAHKESRTHWANVHKLDYPQSRTVWGDKH